MLPKGKEMVMPGDNATLEIELFENVPMEKVRACIACMLSCMGILVCLRTHARGDVDCVSAFVF